ncbi:hypothetical protein LXL04_036548 [Taraxacum kok-saghyz]
MEPLAEKALDVVKKSKADHSMNKEGATHVVALVYVDDVLLMGNDGGKIKEIKNQLQMQFGIKDLGPLSAVPKKRILDRLNSSARVMISSNESGMAFRLPIMETLISFLYEMRKLCVNREDSDSEFTANPSNLLQRPATGTIAEFRRTKIQETSNPSHADTNCGGPKTNDIPLHEKELVCDVCTPVSKFLVPPLAES